MTSARPSSSSSAPGWPRSETTRRRHEWLHDPYARGCPQCGDLLPDLRARGRDRRELPAPRLTMATFALVHGAWHGGWAWDPLAAELQARGHDVLAPDLPCEDVAAGGARGARRGAGGVGGGGGGG